MRKGLINSCIFGKRIKKKDIKEYKLKIYLGGQQRKTPLAYFLITVQKSVPFIKNLNPTNSIITTKEFT